VGDAIMELFVDLVLSVAMFCRSVYSACIWAWNRFSRTDSN